MTFGEKIQSLRKSRGWSQEQLAEQIGVTRQALSKWENGTAIPDTANVIQLAKLFGVTTDYLLLEECTDSTPLPRSARPPEKSADHDRSLIKLVAWVLVFVGGFGLLGAVLWSWDYMLFGNVDTLFGFIREVVIGFGRVLQYKTERLLFGLAGGMVILGVVILYALKYQDESEQEKKP